MKALLLTCGLSLLLAGPALADHAMPKPSTAYQAECGSCHVAFPASLLSREEWGRVMTRLDRHYGSDASLDDKTGTALRAWLEAQAGRPAGAQTGGEPRITGGRWFQREHRQVPTATWKDSRIKSPANCAACHRGAEQGRYGEREIDIPGIGRWEDD